MEAADTTRTKGPKRVGPFAVPKAMSSTASATLATWFKIKGVNYSISSACATSNHCIGAAYEHILAERQDVMFAGGCEELDWTLSSLFDAMGAMSSKFNDTPATASRAYDANRDGFVIAGGAGFAYYWFTYAIFVAATDDAYVGGDLVAVTARDVITTLSPALSRSYRRTRSTTASRRRS